MSYFKTPGQSFFMYEVISQNTFLLKRWVIFISITRLFNM